MFALHNLQASHSRLLVSNYILFVHNRIYSGEGDNARECAKGTGQRTKDRKSWREVRYIVLVHDAPCILYHADRAQESSIYPSVPQNASTGLRGSDTDNQCV